MNGNRRAKLAVAEGCPGFMALPHLKYPLFWDLAPWGLHMVDDPSLQT